MTLYNYEAIDRSGKTLSGKMDAENEWAVSTRLNKMGYTTLEVSEVKESSWKTLFQGRKRVKIGELAFFSRQLAAMLDAGIPLTRCLVTLSEQSGNPKLASCAADVARKVESGMNFSQALSAYQTIFTSMYIDMVKAGEASGSLNNILKRLSEQLEKDKYLQDSIRSATFYPAIVLIFAGLVVLAMMFFVIPIFIGIFPAGVELPLATKIVVFASDSLRNYWYFYLLGLVVVYITMKVYAGSATGQKTWDLIRFRLPVFGDLFKKATIARFCRTLATLLSGGIPVLQALEYAGPASGSKQVSDTVELTSSGIQEGQSIAAPLKKSGFFPPMVTNMIAVGEETGQLANLLGKVADFYEEEVATMTKGLTALIEPILLITVGLTIGAIVIAIYLPIFTVVTTVGR